MTKEEIIAVIEVILKDGSKTVLDLRGKNISTLPPEIGKLTNLTSLNLTDNLLTKLPPEIGQLIKLTSLYLIDNKLTELPEEIGLLTNLIHLNLRDNRLESLPEEIGKLRKLKSFHLRANPLSEVPPEVVKNGGPAVLAYYRQRLAQQTDYVYEAKLLLVGEGGAGKTSLAKKITDPEYQLKLECDVNPERSTQGIDVLRYDFVHPSGKPFRVNIWDFGGQEIYHATHQFFLTKRSLYIIVADTRQDNTNFNYWMDIIETLSEGSPTLIVKNEKQDRLCQINESQLRGRFLNLEKVLATNLATDRGFREILTEVEHYIGHLPHVGTPLPKNWVDVRRALETDTRNYITQATFFHLCEEYGFARVEDKLQLSGYLHDLGVCLHFQDDDVLKHFIILKPAWGTTAVYKVLDTKKIHENLGCFDRKDLNEIWSDNQYTQMVGELLHLMMRFKLCYKIPHRPRHYIVPQLLSPNQPEYNWGDSDNLVLRYQYEFMPKGMLTRFIVEMHRLIDQDLVWKDGVILTKDDTRAEIIEAYYKKEIRIRLSGKLKKPFLEAIRHEFGKIHDSYERLRYQEFIPCNCSICKGSQEPHAYPLQRLRERLENDRQEIECDISYTMVNVRNLIDDITNIQRTSTMTSQPNIFISYSHLDTEWLTKLQTHLKPLVRNQTIALWDDTLIRSGQAWRQEIEQALTQASVAILLVSPNFLASDFIAEHELPPLLTAAKAKGVTILWIPISDSLVTETDLNDYQAAHSPSKPLDTLTPPEQNQALVKICKEIKRLTSDPI
jgi:internalin A